MQLKTILAELNRELTMRRSVWRGFGENKERFAKMEHQRQYDALKYLRDMLEAITPAQWASLEANKAKMEADRDEILQFTESQKSLF